MGFLLDDVHVINCDAYKLVFGLDGRLWFCDLGDCQIQSVDLATLQIEQHFYDDSYCTFYCNGELGFIGTMDGRVLLFRVREKELRTLTTSPKPLPIGPITFDEESESLFYRCGNMIHRVSLDGIPLNRFRCSVASGTLYYSDDSKRLWSACDEIEIFDLETGQSIVRGPERLCPYSQVAAVPTGGVACFGGSIDFFDFDGIRTRSLSGDFNRGVFSSSGRLLANRVSQDMPDDVSISTTSDAGYEFDILSYCNSHVMNSAGTFVVASHCEKLFLFSKEQ